MSQGISDAEVKAIRWVEHILAPLIVVSIVGLTTFALSANQSLAELTTDQQNYKIDAAELREEVKEISREQKVIINNQRHIEKKLERTGAHQEHFKEEIESLKTQNDEILRILRNNGNGR